MIERRPKYSNDIIQDEYVFQYKEVLVREVLKRDIDSLRSSLENFSKTAGKNDELDELACQAIKSRLNEIRITVDFWQNAAEKFLPKVESLAEKISNEHEELTIVDPARMNDEFQAIRHA